jgi:acetyl esterase/lipase
MPRIVLAGRVPHIVRSSASFYTIAAAVALRRLFGRKLAPDWPRDMEIVNLFWREQFNRALRFSDIHEGRAYFDSLQTYTDETFAVERTPSGSDCPPGDWMTARRLQSPVTLLYLHGGGYTLYAAMTRRFEEMLSSLLGMKLFAPDYRLTPEHPHPAQIEDALAAYRYLLAQGTDPSQLVIIGDSAGGHLTLMTLLALREARLPQPALAVGICPWTDIGRRGASLTSNNRYDLLQGYMVIQFGKSFVGDGPYTREELSPIYQDFRGLAPIYLQGGGKEILIDMIRDFANVLVEQGCDVMLDVWEHMTHDFQAHGATIPESKEALERIKQAIAYRTGQEGGSPFASGLRTEVAAAPRKTT